MHQYIVELDQSEPRNVRLEEGARGEWLMESAGQTHRVVLFGHDPQGGLVVEINGRRRTVQLKRRGEDVFLVDAGRHRRVEARSAGEIKLQKPNDATSSQELSPHVIVRSPITGICFEPLVAVGQEVKKGEPVMLVEAMKMENTITAPRDGIVSEVHTRRGDTVFVDDPLVTVSRSMPAERGGKARTGEEVSS